MDEPRTIEHGESASAHWLRERRLRIALLIAFVETLLVLTSEHGWYWVLAGAVLALIVHWFLGRRLGGILYEVTWIAAVSQLVAALVPFIWGLLWWLGTILVVILGLLMLAALLLDRK
jgi:hypothetical protein